MTVRIEYSISGPGGANTNVQYNDSGAFGGDSAFTYNSAGRTVTIGKSAFGINPGSAGLLKINSAGTTISQKWLYFNSDGIYPSADTITAFGIFKADGTTSIVTVDTTNSRIGIGGTPSEILTVFGDTSNTAVGPLLVKANTLTNTIGTALTLDARPNTGGHSWSFISTGPTASIGAGGFAFYDGSIPAYRGACDANGNWAFGGAFNAFDVVEVRKNTSGGIGGRLLVTNYAAPATGNQCGLGFKVSSSFTTDYYSGRIAVISPTGGVTSDMVFYTYLDSGSHGGYERLRITSAGYVGVNTASPNSFFHNSGSQAYAYRAISALRTLDGTDYFIDCTANTFTVTLPTAVGITGRTYIIKNSGTGAITISTTSAQTIDTVAGGTIILRNTFENVVLISDGANWKVIA